MPEGGVYHAGCPPANHCTMRLLPPWRCLATLLLVLSLPLRLSAQEQAIAMPTQLDGLGVPVTAQQNRTFSYTDKRDGYFHGRTHQDRFDDHFAGWNIGTRRVFHDYTLWRDGQPLSRGQAQVTVYPDRLQRRFGDARETLRLFDGHRVLAIELDDLHAANSGISLHGAQLSRARLQDGIAFQTSREAPGKVLAIATREPAARLARRGDVLQTTSTRGFLIVLADTREAARALVDEARRDAAAWAAQRGQRMQAQLEGARAFDSDDVPLAQALAWTRLTLDQLVMQQTGSGIYAGLPWFNDYWGRDMFISLPGATLVNGEFETARDILRSFARYQNTDADSPYFGRVPNRLRPDDVIYNTTDGTPRFVIALHDYLRYSGDRALVEELYPAVQRAIDGPMQRWMDARGYLRHEDADTWMDAKLDEVPWSPRGTRANDIQALWHAQLLAGAAFADLLGRGEDALRWRAVAARVAQHFTDDYVDASGKARMADRLTAGDRADFTLRPNQLFALDLVDDPLARAALTRQVWESLVYPWGVASLSQDDDGFHPWHHADACYPFDSAYHNGTVWLWNNGIAMQRMLEAGQVEPAYALFKHMTAQALHEGAVGSLSENTDALPRPGHAQPALSGAFLQAWSNAEYQRVWYQHFLGIRPDAAQGRLVLAPRMPAELDTVTYGARLMQGELRGRFQRDADGLQRHAYAFDALAAEVTLDFPRHAPITLRIQAGDRVEVDQGPQRLQVRVIGADGRLRASRDRAPLPARQRLQAQVDAVFADVGFAQPRLRSDLPALRTCTP